jgi:hypothetical protein
MRITRHHTVHGSCYKATYLDLEYMAESRFDAIVGLVDMLMARGE